MSSMVIHVSHNVDTATLNLINILACIQMVLQVITNQQCRDLRDQCIKADTQLSSDCL